MDPRLRGDDEGVSTNGRWYESTLRLSILLLFVLLTPGYAHAEAPPDRVAHLQRGINITNWFRFPASQDPAALRDYLSDAALADLRKAGFGALRLPVQPELLLGAADPMKAVRPLTEAIVRLQRQGFAVVVAAHPAQWRLESSEADRNQLLAFWDVLAPAMAGLNPGLTFPELLNEPVFPGAPEAWRGLQHQLLQAVRVRLPDHTIVLTGTDWGSIAGLQALRPEPDGNVIYSFHFYDPAELTSLAAYRPGLDRAALARLPFPVGDRAACFAAADIAADQDTAALIRFYCGLHWDAAHIAARIESAAAWGRRNHAAVLLGEFGATNALDPPARLTWLRTVREASESRGIGWFLWGYDDIMGFAIPRPPPARPSLDPALLEALGLATRM